MQAPVIYWFRQDLRLHDLPGLAAALSSGRPVLACYILDDDAAGQWRPGGASRWWLHHSLLSLSGDIARAGGRLYLARGDTPSVLARLATQSGADRVHCSRQYEPWARQLERDVFSALARDDVVLKRYPGNLLQEPENVSNQAGEPFKVFTPFWRKCSELPVAQCTHTRPTFGEWPAACGTGDDLDDWGLPPRKPDWAAGWTHWWQPGEAGARCRLDDFLAAAIAGYDAGRNHPAQQATSRLSAHMHFGELAPARVVQRVREVVAADPGLEREAAKFLSELGWREFSHHLLYHFPTLPDQPFKPAFAAFPWVGGARELQAWQQGRTGYPLVDAGMRELWQTGYMHNRVRMVVASFLCKHLLVDWRAGQRWFWDTLVDADLANNASGWQWVAGSGADAAPYFRIFNPVMQGQKFDEAGEYVRRWVPELAALPDRYLHAPWTAPEDVLRAAAVDLPLTYPLPMVDHQQARRSALAAYADLRQS